MNCHEVKAQLDSPDCAADGALAPDLRAHLEGCANCARYRERLAAIRDPSSVLRREIPPLRDLWPGIASRLERIEERKEKREIWRIPYFLPLAAAAGIATILAASLFSLPPLPSESPSSAAPTRLPAAAVEIGFAQTRAVLLKRFEKQKNSASPEQIAMLEETLSTMESAVQAIHAALENDPYNASLLFKLSHARKRELRLLQQVVL
jgi:hypothetical protein